MEDSIEFFNFSLNIWFTNPLRDVSLSGNILETLKHIDGLGSDFKTSVGFCGKDGQIAPVGDGGPHTRIQDAIVGGSQ